MLIGFRFKNFRSFKDQASLSMIAHRADKTLPDCLLAADTTTKLRSKILPALAIYGANSAGKTNVLQALSYLRNAVLSSQTNWKPGSGTNLTPYADIQSSKRSTIIEVDFIIDEMRYSYGIAGGPTHFEEEWLISYPAGKETVLYNRTTFKEKSDKYSTNIEYSDKFDEDTSYVSSISKKTRENSLFMSAAAQDNHPICAEIYNWFLQKINEINIDGMPDRMHTMITAGMIHDLDFLKKPVLSLLRSVEPSLVDVIIEKSSKPNYPDFVRAVLPEEARSIMDFNFQYNISFVVKSGRQKIVLPYQAQSKGFQKFFAICSKIITSLRFGEILLIDEMESSIHPHLARMILELFQNHDSNYGRGQIVFTTHDTNLLDQSLLRRDQIWFVEKDKLKSRLYSMLSFSPRKDENLEKGYLRGKYGAIPMLGIDIEDLKSTK